MNPPPTLKMRSLRQPDRAEPKATFLRCLRARSFFLVASLRLSPRLRVSASKLHSRVSHPIPPRARPFPRIPNRRRHPSAVSALVLSFSLLLCAYLRVSASPRQNYTLGFPTPFHHGLVRSLESRTEGDIPPLSPRSFFLSRCFSAPISASPRLRVKITLSGFPPHSTTGSSVPSNPEPKATSLRCLRARSFFLVASLRLSPRLRVSASKLHSRVSHPIPPRARPFPRIPNRRRHPSAVSALVLSFSLLLCAYLRVSASPRQNYTLGFPTPFHHGLVRSLESQVLPTHATPPTFLLYCSQLKNHIQHQRTERKMSGEFNQRS